MPGTFTDSLDGPFSEVRETRDLTGWKGNFLVHKSLAVFCFLSQDHPSGPSAMLSAQAGKRGQRPF